MKRNKNGEKNKSKGIHKESKDYASEAMKGISDPHSMLDKSCPGG